MKLICMTLMIFYGFKLSTSQIFKVVGPSAPLVVKAGEDLILPCSLQPNISAVDMTVEWLRLDLTQANRLVHLYEDREDRNENQVESYRGRTGLFKEELHKGNTSLKLSAAQTSDEGVYKCLIQSGSSYDDTTLQVTVNVHLQLVGPAATLVAVAGEDLVLPCSIQPSISAKNMKVQWSRLHLRQTLVHLYEGYEDKYEDQIESYRGRTGLFKEELQKGNISLKLSAVQPSDEGVYICLVQYFSWFDDITVSVVLKGKGFHAWKISIICISIFGVMIVAFTAYILKAKSTKEQLSPAQCLAVSYLRLQSPYVRSEWNLNKYNTSEEGYMRLIPAVTNCRKAKLTGCNLTENFCDCLALALHKEKTFLIELDLSNSKLQDSAVQQLSVGLNSSYCKLKILRLASCKLTVECCKYLASALQTKKPSLQELDLTNNNLQDSGVEQLSAGLNHSDCKLETLRLAGNNLTVESCQYLTSVLQKENSCLLQLDLNNNNLQDSGVEQLSAGLKSSHCKLKILRMALCSLGEKTCENLASVLTNSLLRELDLSNNDLKNSGVVKLSVGLKSSHCKLEILRLSGCLVTEEGCTSLASALRSNPSHLKELDLTYNNPGESGMKLLSARWEDTLETLRVENESEFTIKPGLRKYVHMFTLDPNIAHRRLTLSEGNRKVTHVKKEWLYADHQDRFEHYGNVLSRESVCGDSVCGRCYWEAEWSGDAVEIAVTYKGISRKGRGFDCVFGRNEKSWSLNCCKNTYTDDDDDEQSLSGTDDDNDEQSLSGTIINYTARHNNKSFVIPVSSSNSNRVGVYVDWPAGTLSFYSVSSHTHTLTHLHTFNSTFTQPLYAGFWVGLFSSVRVLE